MSGFVVVGVDGSGSARKALREAMDQAASRNLSLVVINVVVIPTMSGYEYMPIDLDKLRASAKEMVDDEVEAVLAEYESRPDVEIETRLLAGHIGIELLRAAKADGGAELVVAGSRGLGGFRSLLLGSVTTYLAHHLTCPLLIVPGGSPDDADDVEAAA